MGTRTPMSVQDALWLTTDRPNNLMIIDGVMILATKPRYDAVLDVVRTRVTERFPVYRRKPVHSGAGWAWVDDPDFEPSRHVKAVRLEKPADIAALQRFMSQERGKTLRRDRPLWMVFVIDRVRLDDGTIGGAIVCRFHHAMADGVRLTQVMLSMCDRDMGSEDTGSGAAGSGAAGSGAGGSGAGGSGAGGSADPGSGGSGKADTPGVEAVVSRPEPTTETLALPIPLPAPVAGALGMAADTVKTVGAGVAGVVDSSTHAAGEAVNALVGAMAHAVTHPIDTAVALPHALAAAPGAAWDLARSGAHSLEEGFGIAVHPGRLVDVVTLLGSEQNRAVNDAASVISLLLSNTDETVWSGKPGVAKAMAWSRPISLPEVRAVGRSQGATVNDVLVAAMAGGIWRYLQLHERPVREIQWLVPVNLKPFADNLPEELGNYFALVMLPMPLGAAGPAERIRQMKANMARIKHSDEAVITFGLQRFMSIAPDEVQVFLTNFFANKAVGVLTNVPGPRGLLRFAGSPVTQIVGFAPCSGDQPLTATIFSYNGTVTVGFTSDAALVPDPQVLVELVVQEMAGMQALIAGGTEDAEHRRS